MSHSTDICRGAGLGKYYPECPFRDGTFAYYTEREPIVEDNLQGVGPFLLACLEAEFPEKLEGFPSSPYW
jgi:unsaturated rhamnogalacturonyl hydrolase